MSRKSFWSLLLTLLLLSACAAPAPETYAPPPGVLTLEFRKNPYSPWPGFQTDADIAPLLDLLSAALLDQALAQCLEKDEKRTFWLTEPAAAEVRRLLTPEEFRAARDLEQSHSDWAAAIYDNEWMVQYSLTFRYEGFYFLPDAMLELGGPENYVPDGAPVGYAADNGVLRKNADDAYTLYLNDWSRDP